MQDILTWQGDCDQLVSCGSEALRCRSQLSLSAIECYC